MWIAEQKKDMEHLIDFDKQRKLKNKLYVVVNMQVKQPKGKLARNVAHAVTKVIVHHFVTLKWWSIIRWYRKGMITIVLKSEDIKKHSYKHTIECVDMGITVYEIPTTVAVTFPLGKHPLNIRKLKLL